MFQDLTTTKGTTFGPLPFFDLNSLSTISSCSFDSEWYEMSIPHVEAPPSTKLVSWLKD